VLQIAAGLATETYKNVRLQQTGKRPKPIDRQDEGKWNESLHVALTKSSE
jgi:hypothetical protein